MKGLGERIREFTKKGPKARIVPENDLLQSYGINKEQLFLNFDSPQYKTVYIL